MNAPVSAPLSGGRLHLQHGPIDLIIAADGAPEVRKAALRAAEARFETILQELVDELVTLRLPTQSGRVLKGDTAQRMQVATQPFLPLFVTPMAAVAGAVADTILDAMTLHTVRRAYVNNGGDIALRLGAGARFDVAMARVDGRALGQITLMAQDAIGGVATSGRHGRSLSLGIADSVTVLAKTAAAADAAATLIANAVDLPGHASVQRAPACDLYPDSDLGNRAVVTGVGPLGADEIALALRAGVQRAEKMRRTGQISGAALTLGNQMQTIGTLALKSPAYEQDEIHA